LNTPGRVKTNPTFAPLLRYVSDPRNSTIIRSEVAQSALHDLVREGLLVQEQLQTPNGDTIRVTRLDRDHPDVVEALGVPTAYADNGDAD